MKIAVFLFFIFISANAFGQEKCLTEQEAQSVIARLNAGEKQKENKDLRRELLKMREAREKLETKLINSLDDSKKLLAERHELGKKSLLRLCEIVKTNGWLTEKEVKKEGVDAALYLVINNQAYDLQYEMLSVLAAAANKGLIEKSNIARLADNIRIGRGLPQIFGTQAKISNGIVYIYPLLNELRIEEWRKDYALPPFRDFILELEKRFILPVLKLSRPAVMPKLKQAQGRDETAILGVTNEENEVLQVDTKLVNLNARVFRQGLKNTDDLTIKKEDFAIYENGQEQEISFFSNAEQPFDLILLLDFSGSTVSKQDLIKKAAQRFVETARPADRIAVVGFTDEIRVISDLTSDRAKLTESIKNIEMRGGSRIWDALEYTYKNIIEKQSQGRRSAVIFMTDALDGSYEKTFADIMETVRQGDTTVFPVYLETGDYYLPKTTAKAEKSMWLLAEESGGQLHPAKNVEDLVGIYEQIIRDLSKIYSIGYEPKDEKRNGAWREIKVSIKSEPNLIVRTRRGYYAN